MKEIQNKFDLFSPKKPICLNNFQVNRYLTVLRINVQFSFNTWKTEKSFKTDMHSLLAALTL